VTAFNSLLSHHHCSHCSHCLWSAGWGSNNWHHTCQA